MVYHRIKALKFEVFGFKIKGFQFSNWFRVFYLHPKPRRRWDFGLTIPRKPPQTLRPKPYTPETILHNPTGSTQPCSLNLSLSEMNPKILVARGCNMGASKHQGP